MKIGYDAKRAAANFTGLGNYSRYVISGIAEESSRNDISLYVPRVSKNVEYRDLLSFSNVSEHLPQSTLGTKFSSLWRSFSIVNQLKRDKIEIYHGLSNELPFGINKTAIKSVVTIHDLIFLRLPFCYKFIDRFIYNIKFRYACKNSDKIIAVSECTKRDIIEFYGINPQKVEVIYQGCNKMFKEQSTAQQKEDVRSTYNLPERYILNVGTLEKRKNLFLIVKALKNLPEDIHLVAVGRRTSYSDMVMQYAKTNGISHRVHYLHKVAFKHLPAMYQCAEVFAYPSYYEGFGIPLIEAINCGLPVVAATGSCLEEAAGEGAIYVNPDNVEQFQEVINKLLNDRELRAKLINAGKEHIKKFDEKLLAMKILELYEKV